VPIIGVASRAQIGMASPLVTVETHVDSGLPVFAVVGMPETAVREARDRVKSALGSSRFRFPEGRVVVNLAPADLAKQGARFDLAIAVSILVATRQIPDRHLADFEFLGELSLAGELRPIRGVLPAALGRAVRTTRIIVPYGNHAEAALIGDGTLLPCRDLHEVIRTLTDPASHPGVPSDFARPPPAEPPPLIVGQRAAKRALAVAAAGGHHLLMVGPPGTGKTLLARCIVHLLPRLAPEAALEIAAIYSAGGLCRDDYHAVPFRDPHHSATAPAIIGGGRVATPGEVSLAHGGVLFLDELPHFMPAVLNLLREPLEARVATIARTSYRVAFPARFQLVCAMNPCPSGRVCAPGTCRCTPTQVQHYQNRIPGPLLDRIDMQFQVPMLGADKLTAVPIDDGWFERTRRAIGAARTTQLQRQRQLNGDLAGIRARREAPLTADAHQLLTRAVEGFRLSGRGYHKVIRVAWTIADLDGTTDISASQVAEALSYRAIDWENRLGVGF
jgi:magnesium chelatase family protein